MIHQVQTNDQDQGTRTASLQPSNGIGFIGLLTILFIGLKLTNYINWSWWWVLAPLWAPLALVAGLLAILGTVFITVVIVESIIKRPKA